MGRVVRHRRRPAAWLVFAAALALLTLARSALAAGDQGGRDWAMYGHDPSGSRAGVSGLSPGSVSHGLAVKWRFASPGGPVYGTPAVVGGRVYDADMTGNVFALDAGSGRLVWLSHVGPVADYLLTMTASPLVTSTPVTVRTPAGGVRVSSGQLVIGDQSGKIWGLDRDTGAVLWVTRPNPYGFPAVWGSAMAATVHTSSGPRLVAFVGMSSNEETFTATSAQPCCSSRGSVIALDPTTGNVIWQTYTISAADAARRASGASVWSTPSYDPDLNLVFVTTGNNYGNASATPTTSTSDALMALDAATGRVVWKNQRTPDDTWTIVYRPAPGHPDSDFGDSPKVLRLDDGTKVVVAGQKNGFFHVIDAATGRALSQRQYLPAGGLGGFFASGAATDGVVYANGNEWVHYGGGEIGGLLGSLANTSPPPTAGDLIAIRPGRHGQTQLWRFRVPGSTMLSPPAVAGGVVYVQSTKTGILYAIDTHTGRRLTQLGVGPSVSGPAIAGATLFMGYGDTAGFAATNPTAGGVIAIGAR